MKQNGFTLLEVIIVISLMSVIMALSASWLSNTRGKSTIESGFRNMYSDLQGVRSQALYRKKVRSVTFTSTGYNIYSSGNTAVNPISRTTLKTPISVSGNFQVNFDQTGFITFSNNSTNVNICDGTNTRNVVYNSIIMSQTRIQLGQMSESGCKSAKPL